MIKIDKLLGNSPNSISFGDNREKVKFSGLYQLLKMDYFQYYPELNKNTIFVLSSNDLFILCRINDDESFSRIGTLENPVEDLKVFGKITTPNGIYVENENHLFDSPAPDIFISRSGDYKIFLNNEKLWQTVYVPLNKTIGKCMNFINCHDFISIFIKQRNRKSTLLR